MTPCSPTLAHNRELSDIFLLMSHCYAFLGDEERFRANSYARVSRTIANLKDPVDVHAHSIKELDELPGVGESIAEKILEYLSTGKIATLEKLKAKVPVDLMGLLDIEGVGPSTLRMLYEHGIHDQASLEKAIREGRLQEVKGLAGKKLDRIRMVLKMNKPEEGRMTLGIAWRTGTDIVQALKKVKGLSHLTLAGSLRREKDTVGDIDLVGVAEEKDRKRIIAQFTCIPNCQRVLSRGTTRASILLEKPHVQVDLRLVSLDQYGAALIYFTGSKEHNIALRIMAQKRKWKMNEYGVFDEKGKKLAGETEEGIYALFGLPYIPPQHRLGQHELDAAEKK